jgi:hypothetical protein
VEKSIVLRTSTIVFLLASIVFLVEAGIVFHREHSYVSEAMIAVAVFQLGAAVLFLRANPRSLSKLAGNIADKSVVRGQRSMESSPTSNSAYMLRVVANAMLFCGCVIFVSIMEMVPALFPERPFAKVVAIGLGVSGILFAVAVLKALLSLPRTLSRK